MYVKDKKTKKVYRATQATSNEAGEKRTLDAPGFLLAGLEDTKWVDAYKIGSRYKVLDLHEVTGAYDLINETQEELINLVIDPLTEPQEFLFTANQQVRSITINKIPVPLTLASSTPAHNAINTLLNTDIIAKYSDDVVVLNAAMHGDGNGNQFLVRLKDVATDGDTATLTPIRPLLYSTEYEWFLNVKDKYGQESEDLLKFTTQAAPFLYSVTPDIGTTVNPDTTITVTFTDADAATMEIVETLLVTDTGEEIAHAATKDNKTITITPDAVLTPRNTDYFWRVKVAFESQYQGNVTLVMTGKFKVVEAQEE